MHIIYISSDYSKYGLCTGSCLGQAGCQQSQSLVAPGLPPVRESLILFNYFLILLLARGHELYQLIIYMHEMMMQHLVIRQQLLK